MTGPDPQQSGKLKPRVVVSGASGLVGTRLADLLRDRGRNVSALVRRAPRVDAEIEWDPTRGRIDAATLEDSDAVVHLAGENVAGGRWTAARKRVIRSSRVESTLLLGRALSGLARPPRVFVCASAIGYYGNRGEESLSEQSAPGAGFLADLCREWEAAADAARQAGVRVVCLRIGMVLSADGGALAKMLTPFRLCLGGVIADGRQFMSWIALEDLVRAIDHVIQHDDLAGPVNAVAPRPVTNREFTHTLGRVLRRPTVFPLPAPIVRLVFGEMGQALLLDGARARPDKLTTSGFEFQFPRLEQALRYELGTAQS